MVFDGAQCLRLGRDILVNVLGHHHESARADAGALSATCGSTAWTPRPTPLYAASTPRSSVSSWTPHRLRTNRWYSHARGPMTSGGPR